MTRATDTGHSVKRIRPAPVGLGILSGITIAAAVTTITIAVAAAVGCMRRAVAQTSAASGTGMPMNPPPPSGFGAAGPPPSPRGFGETELSTLKEASRVIAHAAWTKAAAQSAAPTAPSAWSSQIEHSGGAIPKAIASDRLSSSMPRARRCGSLPKRRAKRPSNVSAITAMAMAMPATPLRPAAAPARAPAPKASDR